MNMTHLMSDKLQGKSIQGSNAINQLVEIWMVLEKMRPVDQVDKLLKTATTGAVAENDPLRLKPNPSNLESKIDGKDESEAEDESDKEGGASKVYRPPKIAAMHYDADETIKEKQEKFLEKKKKHALSSSIMRDLKAEHYDGPAEIQEDANMHRAKVDKTGKEREEYEKYFMRMQLSKKK